MTNRKTVAALCAVAVLAGCTMPPTQAELLTFQAVAPEYAAYIVGDPNMPPDGVQRRLDLIESWRIRVGAPKQ